MSKSLAEYPPSATPAPAPAPAPAAEKERESEKELLTIASQSLLAVDCMERLLARTRASSSSEKGVSGTGGCASPVVEGRKGLPMTEGKLNLGSRRREAPRRTGLLLCLARSSYKVSRAEAAAGAETESE